MTPDKYSYCTTCDGHWLADHTPDYQPRRDGAPGYERVRVCASGTTTFQRPL